MATKKISALAAKGTVLATTDLLEISEYDGVSAYVSKRITGANIIDKIKNVLFYANSAAFPVTGVVDFLYVAKDTGYVAIWNGSSYTIINPPSTSENIATNDLVFPANSTTNFAGYKATFDNAEVKIVSDADNNTDKPFEVTKADGSTYIVQVLGDGTTQFNGVTQVSGSNAFFNVLYGGIVVNAYDNNNYNYVLRLQQAAPGYAEIMNVRGNGEIRMEMLPTSDSGLSTGTLFTQTATQLGGSGATKVLCVK
jgi:hypothetical protein